MDLVTEIPGAIGGLPETLSKVWATLRTAFLYIGIAIGVIVGAVFTSKALQLYNQVTYRSGVADKTRVAMRIVLVLALWGGMAYLVYRLFFAGGEAPGLEGCPPGHERLPGCGDPDACVMTACGAGMFFDRSRCACACEDPQLVAENGVCHARCGPSERWDPAIGACACSTGGTQCGDVCCPAGRCTETSDGNKLCCDAGQACGGICCDAGMMCVGGQCRIPCGLGVTCDPRETCLIIGGGGLDEAKLRDTFQVPEERLGAAEDGKYYICHRPAECRQGEIRAVPASVDNWYPCGSRISGDLATGGLRYCTSAQQVSDESTDDERQLARDCFQKTIADCQLASQCRVVDVLAAANGDEVKMRNADLQLAGDQDKGIYCQAGTDESQFKAKYVNLSASCGPDACLTFAPPNTVSASASYKDNRWSCAFVQSCSRSKVLSTLQASDVTGLKQLDPIDDKALTLPCAEADCPVGATASCDVARGMLYTDLCIPTSDGSPPQVSSNCYRCYPNQTTAADGKTGTECAVGGTQQACRTSIPWHQCKGQFVSNMVGDELGRRELGYAPGLSANMRDTERPFGDCLVHLINNTDLSFSPSVVVTYGSGAVLQYANAPIQPHSAHPTLFHAHNADKGDVEYTVILSGRGFAIIFTFTRSEQDYNKSARVVRGSVTVPKGPDFPIYATIAAIDGDRAPPWPFSTTVKADRVLLSIDRFRPLRLDRWNENLLTQTSTERAKLEWGN